jgi:hypothetical protein
MTNKREAKTQSNEKAHFRSEAKQYAEKTLEMPIDDMTHKQRSQMMAQFYVKEVLRRLAPGIVPEDDEDLSFYFVDNANDQQVDFIYRNEGDEGASVLIIQAKYHAKDKPEKWEEFESFCHVLERLHPVYGKKYPKNERLLDVTSTIDWDTDTFDLQYISLGKSVTDIKAREEKGASPFPGCTDIESRSQVRFLGESDLNISLREAISATETITGAIKVRLSPASDGIPWIKYTNEKGRLCYLGKIAAGQLHDIYQPTAHKYRLFSLNIRNYIGDTTTNKEMMRTAKEEPANFFLYNNGISAVATKIEEIDECTLLCERLSIINGAQTVRSLSKVFASGVGSPKTEVLLRLTLVSLSGSSEERCFLDNITRFNNTQNAIKISDFRSNDPIQQSLSNSFSRISRMGKTYWYKNKRSERRDATRIPIGMEEFAKTIYAALYGPIDYFGGTKHLFDPKPRQGYCRIFGNGDAIWDGLEEADFKRLAGIWFVCDEIRSVWPVLKERFVQEEIEAESDQDTADRPVSKNALERRWLVFFAVFELLRRKYVREGLDLDAALRRLANPRWLDNAKCKEKQTILEYTINACEVLIRVYASASTNPNFMHRNWYRLQSTLTAIEREIRLNSTAIRALPMLTAEAI